MYKLFPTKNLIAFFIVLTIACGFAFLARAQTYEKGTKDGQPALIIKETQVNEQILTEPDIDRQIAGIDREIARLNSEKAKLVTAKTELNKPAKAKLKTTVKKK